MLRLSDEGFVVVSQSAGPYTRAFVTDRAGFVRRSRRARQREASRVMQRTPVDRLEFLLALYGYDGVFYSLTFAPELQPGTMKEAMARWRSFLRILQNWREKGGKPRKFDYVYRIERLHDSPHIHCFLRDSDFPPAVVRYLWPWGIADDAPFEFNRVHKEQGYRCLAQYFTKEVPEVGRHAYGVSQTLRKQLPPPVYRYRKTGGVNVPLGAVMLPVREPGINPFGVFSYVRYLSS